MLKELIDLRLEDRKQQVIGKRSSEGIALDEILAGWAGHVGDDYNDTV
jgi:hypothetical protein